MDPFNLSNFKLSTVNLAQLLFQIQAIHYSPGQVRHESMHRCMPAGSMDSAKDAGA
jgi:hypothetical protein